MDLANVKHIVIQTWPKIRMDWKVASKTISEAARSVSSKDRQMLRDLLYAMIRSWPLVSRCLPNRERNDPWRLACGAAALTLDAPFPDDQTDWKGIAAKVIVKSKGKLHLEDVFGMADWLAETMWKTYGHTTLAMMNGFATQARVGLRVNPTRVSRDQVAAHLLELGIQSENHELLPLALSLPSRTATLKDSKLFKDGAFYVQDIGSQLIAELVSAEPGELVVDLCAGAGGKTLALAHQMQGQGRLVSCDTRGGALKMLRNRIKPSGYTNVTTHQLPKTDILRELEGTCDKVLVDAPCSGLGTLRRKPELLYSLSEKRVENLAKLQTSLLEDALRLLKPGGKLIYATCTLLPDENEKVVERFASGGNRTLLQVSEVLGDKLSVYCDGGWLRCFPHKHDTDGFFAALIEKK